MHRFEYHAPTTLAEAISLLDRYGDTARLIAGGTDLLIALKEHQECPKVIISLGAIPELFHLIYEEESGLKLGAMVTVGAVQRSALVQAKYPVLAGAAASLASVQIRNLATVAGNICRASPSADMPPALIALGASVRLVSSEGERLVALDEFFTAPGESVRRPNEILSEINIPPPKSHSCAVYRKHSPRQAMDLAVVGIAVAITLEDHVCREVRIIMGAVAPTPWRARHAESILLGREPTPDHCAEAAEAAAQECSPISDVRGSAAYRRAMVRVNTQRALQQAVAWAESSL